MTAPAECASCGTAELADRQARYETSPAGQADYETPERCERCGAVLCDGCAVAGARHDRPGTEAECLPRTIQPDGWTIHDDGSVQRHDVPAPYGQPSGQWRITGAVTLNNFGYVTRTWTLAEILADPGAIPWKFKNGKQQTHLTDYDHGSHRIRMSPPHSVR